MRRLITDCCGAWPSVSHKLTLGRHKLSLAILTLFLKPIPALFFRVTRGFHLVISFSAFPVAISVKVTTPKIDWLLMSLHFSLNSQHILFTVKFSLHFPLVCRLQKTSFFFLKSVSDHFKTSQNNIFTLITFQLFTTWKNILCDLYKLFL